MQFESKRNFGANHINLATNYNNISLNYFRKGELEKAERIELLRWLENGNQLVPCKINKETISVDTPNDLVDALEIIYKE